MCDYSVFMIRESDWPMLVRAMQGKLCVFGSIDRSDRWKNADGPLFTMHWKISRALKNIFTRLFWLFLSSMSTHCYCCLCICCCFHFCLLLQNHTWIVLASTSSSFANSSVWYTFGDGSTSKYSFSLFKASGGNTVRFCRLKWALWSYLQRGASDHSQGFKDKNLGSSPVCLGSR